MIRGVDVSMYQGTIDWNAVKKSGIEFAIAKATEGSYVRDPEFQFNWPRMKEVGLIRGAYHFLHPNQDIGMQVNNLHTHVRNSGHFKEGDFVALDVEVTDGEPAYVIERAIRAFCVKALHDIDKQVIIYSGQYFWDQIFSGKPDPVIANRPLWIASWTPDGYPHQNYLPKPFAGFGVTSFWQYADNGIVPGIQNVVDLDIFNGSMAQLKMVTAHPKG